MNFKNFNFIKKVYFEFILFVVYNVNFCGISLKEEVDLYL